MLLVLGAVKTITNTNKTINNTTNITNNTNKYN